MTAPRGPERRVGPRREAERVMHYATLRVIAAAMAVADDPTTSRDFDPMLRRLDAAVGAYRRAEQSTWVDA